MNDGVRLRAGDDQVSGFEAHQIPKNFERPSKLRGDLLTLVEMSGDPDEVLKGSGVKFSDILAQTPLCTGIIADLFDRLARTAPTGFAFACGRQIRLQYLGMLGYRLSNSATIGDLIADWTHYSLIIGYPLASTFKIDGARWRIEFYPRYRLSEAAGRFCIESTLAGFVPSLFNMTAHQVDLEEIAFPYDAPSDLAPYRALDASQVSFGSSIAAITGSTEDLNLLIMAADPALREVCEAYCQDSLLDLLPAASFQARLKSVLRQMAPPWPDERRVCDELAMSARALQRNLAAEGTNFQRLIDEVRYDDAIAMLQRGCTTKSIAFDLGYSEASSFFRAFRRWSGMSPTAWRAHFATTR